MNENVVNSSKTPDALSFREYSEKIGADKLTQVLSVAGVNVMHFRQIARGYRKCGAATFEKVFAAARTITPGITPDYEKCTRYTSSNEAQLELQQAREARKLKIKETIQRKITTKKLQIKKLEAKLVSVPKPSKKSHVQQSA